MQFDTGCTIAMVETVSESQRPDVEFFQVPVYTVNRSKLEMATVPVKYSFANCEIQYTRSIVLMNDVPYCDKELSFKDMYPIVGTYGLFWRRLKLDFTNSCLRIICHHQDSIDLTGYQEVKCKYMLLSNALKIYLTIDGEEHECLFDTGNESGFIILKDKNVSRETVKMTFNMKVLLPSFFRALLIPSGFARNLGRSLNGRLSMQG